MRRSEASLAVIRSQRDGEPRWLAIWNAKWNAFHFVGGHRRPEESYLACMTREIFEELGLQDGVDCQVNPTPLAHLDYTAWSNQAQAETQYAMELFAVELDEQAERTIQGNPEVRWLSDEEIRSEWTQDSRPVSPTMGLLIDKAELL